MEEREYILSILIPTIPTRADKLEVLLAELRRQIDKIDAPVDISVCMTAGFLEGGPSIGRKRNHLVQTAKGKYVCFLDDDETISPQYIETLVELCGQEKDVCTFRSLFKLVDYWGIVDMRLVYKVNDQASPEYTIRRPPWHMCPVRAEFAKRYEFENVNNAEDFAWFEKVLARCTTEAHTERILFQYNHGAGSEADRIENAKN